MNLINLRHDLIKELKPFIENKIKLKDKMSIWEQESERDKLIIVLDGTVKASHMLPNSKELLLGIYKSEVIIFPAIFNMENNFSSLFKISTLTECTIGTISINTLKNIIDKDINILRNLCLYHDYLCQKIFLQLRDISIYDKKISLFSILIRLYNTYGIETKAGFKINTKLSNIILSEYIGTTPETISRLISKLKSENLIDFNRGYLTIKDLNYLKETLGCSKCNENLCLF
ncbi:Crp/Fnr family transcriptional regulator [Eubacterium multiforme]|uniref:CRP/FNR family transcriptional regulator n=1 Tax=Eubacterium multiforme TaxID=83339 RepID=A0ABT9UR62_9FIRM|nr:Crp/Fnr family transcriptional regulator [Eubacterium multiforme]MDQ0148170.1 CRP/FNR family transcriptional regulator [Eubacterium multiforme]